MSALVWGGGAVALAFLAQVGCWRWRVPQRQTRTLLVLFLASVGLVATCLALVPPDSRAALATLPSSLAELARVVLLGVALSLAYVISWSAVEARSPTLAIVLDIEAAGPEGLGEDELRARLPDAVLLEPRIADLLRDGLAAEQDGRIRLTPKGSRFLSPLLAYRRLLGAGKGG